MGQPIAAVNITRRVEQNEVAILRVASCLVTFQARPGSHFGPNFITKIAAIGVKTRRILMDALLRKSSSKWSHLNEKNRYQQQTEIQNCLLFNQSDSIRAIIADSDLLHKLKHDSRQLGNRNNGANDAACYDVFRSGLRTSLTELFLFERCSSGKKAPSKPAHSRSKAHKHPPSATGRIEDATTNRLSRMNQYHWLATGFAESLK